jgi:glutamine amidotransferase
LTVILDYGMGNLRSVEKAVQLLGAPCAVQGDLKGASKLIIPGVGAFGAAMERIAPLKGEITKFARDGGPILGICLGQQLLFESSEELGSHAGLGLLPGVVRYLPKQPGLKVPHMGWNDLRFRQGSQLGSNFPPNAQVYFVHSLYTDCADKADVAAWCEYGITFPAAIERGTIWGTQFHPEKSSAVGLSLLNNFLQLQP